VEDESSPWVRPLLIAVGSLLAVALVIGGVVSAVALGAAGVVGLGDSGNGPAAEPSLYMPSTSPSPSPSEQPQQSEPAQTPTKPPAESDSERKKDSGRKKDRERKKEAKKRGITLNASPARVGSYDRINLTGRYPGRHGASVQVQRFEGRWVRFPASASVRGGRFSTYVASGQTGKNRFRVVDGSGKRSNPVSVIVR
jgi:hypothetical protein